MISKNVIIASMLWLCTACFNPKNYEPRGVDQVINITAYTTSAVKADGVATGKIEATISNNASLDRRTVVFKTSSGTFVNGQGDSISVVANEDFVARADLTSLSASESLVTAKISGYTTPEVKISFIKAFPDKITISVDSFSVNADYKGETLVSAQLSTDDGGKPSKAHQVVFSARTETDNLTIGTFLNDKTTQTTDISGIAKIRFSPGNTTYRGFVILKAATKTENDSAFSQTKIYVK
jgi:hypothetical protein